MVALVDGYDEKTADKVVHFINSARLFRYFFTEIDVRGINRLKDYISHHPETVCFYGSKHMSLFDFMMFRKITHENGFKGNRAARIIAGKNLDVWPLSILWRKMGGLSFDRKNKNYSYLSDVSDDSTNFLINNIDTCVYLEGTRIQSEQFDFKTTFLTPPLRAHNAGKDISMIPVWNSYDDPIEDKTGLEISQKLKFLDKIGMGKLRHITDVYMFGKRFAFDGPIGKAKLYFGEPIPLRDIANGNQKKAKNNLYDILKERVESLRLSA